MIFMKYLQSENLQLSLFVVDAIFIGFSTTVLAIFLILSSNKTVARVGQTNIMLEKINHFTKSLRCMTVSMIVFLSSILGLFDFFKISRFLLVVGLLLFLIGFAYYLIASYDLIKMLKILYSIDEGKRRQTIADFVKEIQNEE